MQGTVQTQSRAQSLILLQMPPKRAAVISGQDDVYPRVVTILASLPEKPSQVYYVN